MTGPETVRLLIVISGKSHPLELGRLCPSSQRMLKQKRHQNCYYLLSTSLHYPIMKTLPYSAPISTDKSYISDIQTEGSAENYILKWVPSWIPPNNECDGTFLFILLFLHKAFGTSFGEAVPETIEKTAPNLISTPFPGADLLMESQAFHTDHPHRRRRKGFDTTHHEWGGENLDHPILFPMISQMQALGSILFGCMAPREARPELLDFLTKPQMLVLL